MWNFGDEQEPMQISNKVQPQSSIIHQEGMQITKPTIELGEMMLKCVLRFLRDVEPMLSCWTHRERLRALWRTHY